MEVLYKNRKSISGIKMKIINGTVTVAKDDVTNLINIMEMAGDDVFNIMEDIFIEDEEWNDIKNDMDLDNAIGYFVDNYQDMGMTIKEAERAFESSVETETVARTDKKVYFEDDTLWLAYGQGSGTTSYLPNIKKYLSNDPEDTEHYDSLVDSLLKWSEVNKPLKKKSDVSLHEVPYYDRYEYGRTLDVWDGNVTPSKKFYLTISNQAQVIVNIFDNKKEALNWINSIS